MSEQGYCNRLVYCLTIQWTRWLLVLLQLLTDVDELDPIIFLCNEMKFQDQKINKIDIVFLVFQSMTNNDYATTNLLQDH